jgi:glycogen phosphorylase
MAPGYTVHDRMLDRNSFYGARVEAITAAESSTKVVAYLSAELPIGPHLGNGLIRSGLWQAARRAVPAAGVP